MCGFMRLNFFSFIAFSCLPVDEFCLLKCLMCGGFTQGLVSTVMWYSSGGTKSVLHYDSVDNINCIFDGRKEIFFVDKVRMRGDY